MSLGKCMMLSPLLIPRFYLGSFNKILDIEHHHKPARLGKEVSTEIGVLLIQQEQSK